LRKTEFDVVFILPRRSKAPVGGFKITYEYANGLAEKGFRVLVAHGIVFRGRNRKVITSNSNPRKVQAKHLIALLVGVLLPKGKEMSVRWFETHPKVQYRDFPLLTFQYLPSASHYIATSWRTAMFLEGVGSGEVQGHYLIQGFESWDNSGQTHEYVTSTWKSGLSNIVISEWLMDMAKKLGVPAKLVPNFVDRDEFPSGPEVKNRPIDILFHASTHKIKRLDRAIEVVTAIREEFPDLSFMSFGTEYPPKALPDWCQYTRNPSRKKLSELYMQSKIFLVTSDSEGWCLPALESMSSGAVVVSTRNGGVDSFAPNVAVFPDSNSSADLVKTIREIVKRRNEMSLQSKANAGIALAKTFDREKSIQGLISLLEVKPCLEENIQK